MTAALPLAEPPADDVTDLLELVARARLSRDGAHLTMERKVAESGTANLEPTAKMFFDVERVVAVYRCTLWDRVVASLEDSAREIGLEP